MGHTQRVRRWSMALMMGFLIGLFSVGMAACSFRASGESQVGTPVALHLAQTQPTQALRQFPTRTARPAQQVQKCGVIFAYGALAAVPQDGNLAIHREDCFWQAFQHCRPAMLIFTAGGIAKRASTLAITRTFTIHATSGACSLSDMLQQGTFPYALLPASATYLCTGLRRLPNALEMLSCGRDGNVSVLGM